MHLIPVFRQRQNHPLRDENRKSPEKSNLKPIFRLYHRNGKNPGKGSQGCNLSFRNDIMIGSLLYFEQKVQHKTVNGCKRIKICYT